MRKTQESAQRRLGRYIHYYNMWKGHVDSAEKEHELRLKIEEKILRLEEEKELIFDYSWILTALEQLFKSRKVLANSYVFAYYMFGNEMFSDEISEEQNKLNQNLFEDNQEQLISVVERLSDALNTPVEEVGQEHRLLTINLTAMADTRCYHLFRLVEDLLAPLQTSSQSIAPYKLRSSTYSHLDRPVDEFPPLLNGVGESNKDSGQDVEKEVPKMRHSGSEGGRVELGQSNKVENDDDDVDSNGKRLAAVIIERDADETSDRRRKIPKKGR